MSVLLLGCIVLGRDDNLRVSLWSPSIERVRRKVSAAKAASDFRSIPRHSVLLSRRRWRQPSFLLVLALALAFILTLSLALALALVFVRVRVRVSILPRSIYICIYMHGPLMMIPGDFSAVEQS